VSASSYKNMKLKEITAIKTGWVKSNNLGDQVINFIDISQSADDFATATGFVVIQGQVEVFRPNSKTSPNCSR